MLAQRTGVNRNAKVGFFPPCFARGVSAKRTGGVHFFPPLLCKGGVRKANGGSFLFPPCFARGVSAKRTGGSFLSPLALQGGCSRSGRGVKSNPSARKLATPLLKKGRKKTCKILKNKYFGRDNLF